MHPTPLTPEDTQERLRSHPQWQLSADGRALTRRFPFADFAAAFAFMGRLAETIVRLNHDPEWTYAHTQVLLRLTTHDANGVTELDFQLARAADDAFAQTPPG